MTDRRCLDRHTDHTLTRLYDQRDQARDIAVALENELARAEAERDQHAAAVLAECDAMEQAMADGHASLNRLRDHIARIRTALAAQPQDGPTSAAAHTGGNAEDCDACAGTNPPYPFTCPAPDGHYFHAAQAAAEGSGQ